MKSEDLLKKFQEISFDDEGGMSVNSSLNSKVLLVDGL